MASALSFPMKGQECAGMGSDHKRANGHYKLQLLRYEVAEKLERTHRSAPSPFFTVFTMNLNLHSSSPGSQCDLYVIYLNAPDRFVGVLFPNWVWLSG